MKKVLYLMILMISLFVLSSCKGDEIPEITLPIETEPVDTNPQETVPTEPSETIPTEPLTLDIPQNVILDQYILNWDAVSQASSYIIKIGETEISINGLSFDLKTLSVLPGTYTLNVIAVNGDIRSLPSSTLTYTLESSANPDQILSQLLSFVDEDYTSDLTQDDFHYQEDYTNYITTLHLLTHYAKASSEMGMSEEDAINFFSDTVQFGEGLPEMDSFSIMLSQMKMFDEYQMSSDMIAKMLYELALGSIDAQIIRYEFELNHYGDLSFKDFSLVFNEPFYQTFYDLVKSYATPEQYAAVDHLFYQIEHPENYELMLVFYDSIYSYLNIGEYIEPHFGWIDDEVMVDYVHDIIDLVTSMYQAGQNAELESFVMDYGPILEQLEHDYWVYITRSDHVDDYLSRIEQYTALKDLFVIKEEMIVESLDIVINYLLTMKDALSTDLLILIDDLIENEFLSPEEVLMLKDEMIYLLQENLPSSDDFSTLFEMFYHIANVMNDSNLSMFESHTSWMGETTHASFDLVLSFIGTIDLDDLEFVEYFTENMVLTVFDPMFGEDIFVGYNLVAFVELYQYISEMVETFVLDHPQELITLNQLLSPENIEGLYISFLDYEIQNIENNYYFSNEDKQDLIDLITFYQGEFDTIVNASLVINSIGMAAFEVLQENDFMLILNLYSLMSYVNTPFDVFMEEILSLLDAVTTDLRSLNTAVIAELDQEAILAILDLVRLPLYSYILNDDASIDVEAIYADVREDLALIISNLLSLESDLVDTLSLINFSLIPSMMPEAMIGQLFEMVGTFLNNENETLIIDTWTLLFDNVLSHPDIMYYLDATIEDVIQARDFSTQAIQDYIDELQEMSSWDFDNLTPEQSDAIMALIEMIQDFFAEDNPYDQSAPIYLDEKMSIFLDTEVTSFKLYIPQTTTYAINTSILAESGFAVINIFDEDLNFYGYYEYNHDEKLFNQFIQIEFDAGTTYYIVVETYNMFDPYLYLEVDFIENFELDFNLAGPIISDLTYTVYQGDFDLTLYAFTPEVSKTYYIYSMCDFGEIDPVLYLFGPNQTFIGIYDDSELGLNFNTDGIYMSAGLTYYLLITNYNPGYVEIPFIISSMPFDGEISYRTIHVFEEIREFLPSSNNVYFQITIDETMEYNFTTFMTNDIDFAYVHIMDSNYNEIMGYSLIGTDKNYSQYFDMELVAGQTYYIHLEVDTTSNPFYFFSIEPLFAYYNGLENAEVIYAEETNYANIDFYDNMYYQFTADSSDTYYFYSLIEFGNTDPFIIILDDNFYFIAEIDDTEMDLNFNLDGIYLEAGQTIYIVLSSHNIGQSFVPFMVSTEQKYPTGEYPVLQVSEASRGYMSNGSIIYELTVDETLVYSVSADILKEGSMAQVSILDDLMNPITTYVCNEGNKDYFTWFEIELIADTTYYVKIEVIDGASPYYALEVMPTAQYGLDFSESIVVTSEVIIEAYPNFMEYLYYSFTADATATYHIYSLNDYSFSDPFISVFDSEYNYITYQDDTENDLNFNVSGIQMNEGETYYFIVSSYAPGITEVPFVISTKPLDNSNTNPLDSAIEIFAGDTITTNGNFTSLGVYLFNPTISAYYDVYSLAPDSSINPIGYIMNAGLENVGFDDDNGDFLNFFMEKVYLVEGQSYYIVVFAQTEEPVLFDFHLSLPDTSYIPPYGTNTSVQTAILIEVNEMVTLTAKGEFYFYYAFEPLISGRYVIYSRVNDSSIDPYINLYNQDMVWLSASDDDGTYMNFELEFDAVAGEIYYFEIGLFNMNIVTFDFQLLKIPTA